MRRIIWPNVLIALAPVLAFAASDYGDGLDYSAPPLPLIAAPSPSLSQQIDTELTTVAREGGAYDQKSGCEEAFAGCTIGYCPLWTVRAGAIFLRRDSQDNLTLTNGATPITVGGLSFNNYQAGPLVTVIRNNAFNTPYDFETTYFGIPSFSNTATSAGATSFFSVPSINFGARTVTGTYSSNFHSTELNLRRRWSDWFTVINGFRWFEIRDNLAADFGGGASDTINVNNHLYGYQVGADVVFYRRGRFTIDGFGKAGIYANNADQSTALVGVAGAVSDFRAGSTRSAFLGELSLNGMYAINDHWSIRSGYQALWLDGVALAPDQIATSNIATGVSTLDLHGHPIYHGMTIAAQVNW